MKPTHAIITRLVVACIVALSLPILTTTTWGQDPGNPLPTSA